MRWTNLIPACLLLTILTCSRTYCQELSYKQYTVKDGLPGSTVYQALEDRKGFIWFATNQGVSRFDGRTFTNYYKEDGLPDNDIIKLYLDQYDNIWLISFIGIPAVLHKGVITTFPGCKNVLSVCEDPLTDSIVLMTAFDKGNRRYWGFYSSRQDPAKWQFKEHLKEASPVPLNFPMVRASGPGKTSFYFSVVNKKNYALTIQNNSTVKQFNFRRDALQTCLPFCIYEFAHLAENKNGIVFYSTDWRIYYANLQGMRAVVLPEKKLHTGFIKDINCLYCENDSTLWVCSRNRGLLRIKNFLSAHPDVHSFFSKSFCTFILKDREKGYWLTTHGDGVYYLPNLCFHTLSAWPDLMEKNALSVRSIGRNCLVAGFADGNIIKINSTDASSQSYPGWTAKNRNNRIMDACLWGGDTLLVGTDGGLKTLSSRGSSKILPRSTKELHLLANKTILVATYTDVVLLKQLAYKRRLFNERTTCITHQNGQYFWGTLHGAYACVNDTVSNLGWHYPELAGIINHLDIAPDSSLWASTQQGLVILKNNVITPIRKEQGMPGNMCKHVSFENNTAWVSTDKGIARIDYRWNNKRLVYSLSDITEEDGLTTNNVNRTLPAGNYIWAATARGISFFSKNYISHSALSPLININKIAIDNEPVPVTDTLQINYPQRKLHIELSGISYRSGKQIYYEYRLPKLDSSWSRISNDIIEFQALPFGRFVFEVRSVDRWGKTSDQPKKILVINTAPFWETNAFRLLSVITVLTLFGFSFYTYYSWQQRSKEKEYQLKKKMHNLEMMALRAQMNPHFIFNCLTSIQYHIVRADTRKANNYLHKFSTLIRQILQHSTDSLIALQEEIKILELYLELEKLRLGEKMEYHIHVPEALRQGNQAIPVMIVQPFVENAIKHGIACLEDKKGVLTIEIRQTGNYIDFLIEDNGPGIYAAVSADHTQTPDHLSMGTGITASRISTINAIQKQKILLQVTDKQASGHAETGTIVHLSFPIITD